MNARLCPNCSALIESASALFCYNCGQELPLSHTESSHAPASLINPTPKDAPKKSLIPIFVFLFFASILILTITFLRQTVFKNEQIERTTLSPTQNSSLPPVNEYVSTVPALPVAPYSLEEAGFASLIPSEASLFIQSRTPALLLKRTLTEQNKEQFSKKTGLSLTEALSFLSDDYAYAKLPGGFLFLSKVKDVDFVKSKIREYSNEVIGGIVVGDVLAVSDSPDILNKVNLSSNRKLLSLEEDSEFFESRRNLPKIGQATIFSRDGDLFREGLVLLFGKDAINADLDQLKGRSFIIDSVSGSLKIIGSYGK